MYLAQDGDTLIVLFGGGTKATQRKDVAQAMELLLEYRSRKRASRAVVGKKRRGEPWL